MKLYQLLLETIAFTIFSKPCLDYFKIKRGKSVKNISETSVQTLIENSAMQDKDLQRIKAYVNLNQNS